MSEFTAKHRPCLEVSPDGILLRRDLHPLAGRHARCAPVVRNRGPASTSRASTGSPGRPARPPLAFISSRFLLPATPALTFRPVDIALTPITVSHYCAHTSTMGLRRKKHGDSCDCAICERERPKPTYISLDEDFYHLSVSPLVALYSRMQCLSSLQRLIADADRCCRFRGVRRRVRRGRD